MSSNKDDMDNFTKPVGQMLRNAADTLKYGIGDAIADKAEQRSSGNEPKQKGCLWTVIKWYILISIIAGLLSECGSSSQSQENTITNEPSSASSETLTLDAVSSLHTSPQYHNPRFSDPEVLTDLNLEYVDIIKNNYAVVTAVEKGNSTQKFLNLKTGKAVAADSTLVDTSGLEYGYIRQFQIDDDENTITANVVDLKGNSVLTNPGSGISVAFIFWEKDAYVAKRSTTSLTYSGYEYATISFDGEIITDWILEPTENGSLLNLGDGVFYAGSSQPDNGLRIHYAMDMYNGTVFEWPRIEYMPESSLRHITVDELLPSAQWNPFYSGNGANAEFSLRGMSSFFDGRCIAYLEGEYVDTPLIFYSIDRTGHYQEISRVQQARDVKYIENLAAYVCVSYEDAYDMTALDIFDMYGNAILNITDAKITGYDLGEEYITIVQENIQGSITNTFYSFYDYQGNQLHAPFCVNNQTVQPLPKLGGYALIGETGMRVYTMDDELIYEFAPITAKDKGAIFTIERTYVPSSLDIYDEYYVLNCLAKDNIGRSFIGKLDYVDQSPAVLPATPGNREYAIEGSIATTHHTQTNRDPDVDAYQNEESSDSMLSDQILFTGYVTDQTEGLNVRSGPGTKYEKVGRLASLEEVVIYETTLVGDTNWGRIGDGEWVSMDYIIVTSGSNTTEAARMLREAVVGQREFLLCGAAENTDVCEYTDIHNITYLGQDYFFEEPLYPDGYFTVVDMDCNGVNEVVVTMYGQGGWYLLLRYQDGEVYGNVYGDRWLEICKNGMAFGSAGASSTTYFRLSFDGIYVYQVLPSAEDIAGADEIPNWYDLTAENVERYIR